MNNSDVNYLQNILAKPVWMEEGKRFVTTRGETGEAGDVVHSKSGRICEYGEQGSTRRAEFSGKR